MRFHVDQRVIVGKLLGTVVDPHTRIMPELDGYQQKPRIQVVWDGGDGKPVWVVAANLKPWGNS